MTIIRGLKMFEKFRKAFKDEVRVELSPERGQRQDRR